MKHNVSVRTPGRPQILQNGARMPAAVCLCLRRSACWRAHAWQRSHVLARVVCFLWCGWKECTWLDYDGSTERRGYNAHTSLRQAQEDELQAWQPRGGQQASIILDDPLGNVGKEDGKLDEGEQVEHLVLEAAPACEGLVLVQARNDKQREGPVNEVDAREDGRIRRGLRAKPACRARRREEGESMPPACVRACGWACVQRGRGTTYSVAPMQMLSE